MERGARQHLVHAVGPILGVVYLRVHMVLDEMVALPVQAIWPTAFLIDKGMPCDISGQVAHPAESKGLESIFLWAPRLIRLIPQMTGEFVSLAVVEHVAPEEGLLVVSLRHTASEEAEAVVL